MEFATPPTYKMGKGAEMNCSNTEGRHTKFKGSFNIGVVSLSLTKGGKTVSIP